MLKYSEQLKKIKSTCSFSLPHMFRSMGNGDQIFRRIFHNLSNELFLAGGKYNRYCRILIEDYDLLWQFDSASDNIWVKRRIDDNLLEFYDKPVFNKMEIFLESFQDQWRPILSEQSYIKCALQCLWYQEPHADMKM